ncbi:hypothetical protein HYALB_00006712 [Hymenoscyphus albidus]|uniref:Uncharacterized protein n=1 Tax=Hymenoscyphus albidus TaxID=595503 RepID=A0A9N9Q0F9_9HELO|nr:hypothetical protein HYALB_00006712 [Hymenoscyphus albidus]
MSSELSPVTHPLLFNAMQGPRVLDPIANNNGGINPIFDMIFPNGPHHHPERLPPPDWALPQHDRFPGPWQQDMPLPADREIDLFQFHRHRAAPPLGRPPFIAPLQGPNPRPAQLGFVEDPFGQPDQPLFLPAGGQAYVQQVPQPGLGQAYIQQPAPPPVHQEFMVHPVPHFNAPVQPIQQQPQVAQPPRRIGLFGNIPNIVSRPRHANGHVREQPQKRAVINYQPVPAPAPVPAHLPRGNGAHVFNRKKASVHFSNQNQNHNQNQNQNHSQNQNLNQHFPVQAPLPPEHHQQALIQSIERRYDDLTALHPPPRSHAEILQLRADREDFSGKMSDYMLLYPVGNRVYDVAAEAVRGLEVWVEMEGMGGYGDVKEQEGDVDVEMGEMNEVDEEGGIDGMAGGYEENGDEEEWNREVEEAAMEKWVGGIKEIVEEWVEDEDE